MNRDLIPFLMRAKNVFLVLVLIFATLGVNATPAPVYLNLHVFYQDRYQHYSAPYAVVQVDGWPSGTTDGNGYINLQLTPGQQHRISGTYFRVQNARTYSGSTTIGPYNSGNGVGASLTLY
jgi:hypothetical protein